MINMRTKAMTIKTKHPYRPLALKEAPNPEVWKKLWYRMHEHNKMVLIVIVGKPGIGKTWLAVSLGMLLDRLPYTHVTRFKPSHFALGPLEFMEQIKGKHPKGSMFVNDDAGLTADAREALSLVNKTLSKVIQSCREGKNYGLILTLPSFTMLDKNIRDLADVIIEVHGWDTDTNESIFKFHWLSLNPMIGKRYHQRPMGKVSVEHPDGMNYNTAEKIDQLRMPMGDKYLIEACKKKKLAYIDQEYSDFYRELLNRTKRRTYADKLALAKERIDQYTFTDEKGNIDIDTGLIYADRELNITNPVDSSKIAKTLRRSLIVGGMS